MAYMQPSLHWATTLQGQLIGTSCRQYPTSSGMELHLTQPLPNTSNGEENRRNMIHFPIWYLSTKFQKGMGIIKVSPFMSALMCYSLPSLLFPLSLSCSSTIFHFSGGCLFASHLHFTVLCLVIWSHTEMVSGQVAYDVKYLHNSTYTIVIFRNHIKKTIYKYWIYYDLLFIMIAQTFTLFITSSGSSHKVKNLQLWASVQKYLRKWRITKSQSSLSTITKICHSFLPLL